MRKVRPSNFAQALFPLLILTLLAGLTFWLEHTSRVVEEHNDGRYRHDPDYTVDNFTLRRLDAQGKLEYSLVADAMLHYPDDDSTEVIAPRLTHVGRPQPMHLSAKRAHVSKDGNEVVLYEDVRAVREATAKDPEVVVTTSQLSVYPDRDFAVTDKPVRIVQGQSVMNGVGMEIDQKNMVYKLLSNTHGTIYRKKNPPETTQ
jgi:lipopolysaccharide export system protein LptC